MINKAYGTNDDSEVSTGRHFRLYSKSRFLDYVAKATFASGEYPGPLHRRCVGTERSNSPCGFSERPRDKTGRWVTSTHSCSLTFGRCFSGDAQPEVFLERIEIPIAVKQIEAIFDAASGNHRVDRFSRGDSKIPERPEISRGLNRDLLAA